MRRPNIKWIFKTACLLLIAGTIFLLITGYLSATPYTNRLPIQRPNAVPYVQEAKQNQRLSGQLANEQPVAPPPMPEQRKKHIVVARPALNDVAPPVEPPKIVRNHAIEEDNNAAEERDELQVPPHEENAENFEDQDQQQQQVLPPNVDKKDWHDYTAMDRDAKRVGFGEQGKRATNGNEADRELEKKMSLDNGFNAYISDMISVNRSVPDIRYKG